MKTFRFYFLDGRVEEGEGDDVAKAFTHLGYGAGALASVDHYEEVTKMTIEEKIKAMTNDNLITVWRSLGEIDWGNDEMHSPGVTMNYWAEMIDNEMSRRQLHRLPTHV